MYGEENRCIADATMGEQGHILYVRWLLTLAALVPGIYQIG